MTEGFDRPSDVVHELGAATNQSLARADYGKVGLGAFAPVPQWVQELRIHSCQAGEVLKASTSSVFRLLA